MLKAARAWNDIKINLMGKPNILWYKFPDKLWSPPYPKTKTIKVHSTQQSPKINVVVLLIRQLWLIVT